MPSTALFVHVPVDKIEIFSGPGSREWIEISQQLSLPRTAAHESYVEHTFRLRTAASKRLFSRKLKLTSISLPLQNYSHLFTAIFCNQAVSGVYSTQARAGWFSLD